MTPPTSASTYTAKQQSRLDQQQRDNQALSIIRSRLTVWPLTWRGGSGTRILSEWTLSVELLTFPAPESIVIVPLLYPRGMKLNSGFVGITPNLDPKTTAAATTMAVKWFYCRLSCFKIFWRWMYSWELVEFFNQYTRFCGVPEDILGQVTTVSLRTVLYVSKSWI